MFAVASAAPAAVSRATPTGCRSDMRTGVLPAWARGGFSDPRPRIPHVVGRGGKIVAILFGYPLVSPPAKRRSNKILWVSRSAWRGQTDLRIRAQRMESDRPVGRPVARTLTGGPGPSIVDLPAPGCWRLTLRWGGRSDRLDLRYRPNR
jgi:hypothetical protein